LRLLKKEGKSDEDKRRREIKKESKKEDRERRKN
jgi:hypothetical protein